MKNLVHLALFLYLGVTSIMCSKESEPNSPTAPEATGEVTVAKTTYSGWNDAYEMTNGLVKVVVVPAIGRIMYYAFVDGANILWNNPSFYGKTLPYGQPYRENGAITWANFGGDKVWPTEQSQFPDINGYAWPPDHWFDGGAHAVDEIADGVRLSSQVSNYCGAQSIREIILDPFSSELKINQTIRKAKRAQNSSVEPIEYTIWNVTQIRPPKMALLRLNPNSRLEDRIHLWQQADANLLMSGDVATFFPHPTSSQKAGADSDFWLAAIVDNIVIGEFFRLQTGVYPDNGLSAEVYNCPDYTELELLSPFARLSTGESTHFTISWRLTRLPSDAVSSAQKRDAAVAWLDSFQE